MKDLRRPANVLGRLHSLASTSRFLDFIAAESNATGQALGSFKTWFWRPPRPHGATIIDRRVSPLEVLYDLVYAVVVSQAAGQLAEHVSVGTLVEFSVVFSMTWIAWTNGSLYLELHGRADGRTRTYVFVQMGILAVLAVFAADAAGGGGRAFAFAYAAFLVVMTWLWYTVRRQDRVERPEFLVDTGRYGAAMVLSVLVIVVSAFLPAELRLIVWAVFLLLLGRSRIGLGRALFRPIRWPYSIVFRERQSILARRGLALRKLGSDHGSV